MLELKGRSATYVAVTDDNLDTALAEYINASTDPNKLTTLFIRERDGVYQFGSKRVYVKMEGGKIFSKPRPNPSPRRRRLPAPRRVPAHQRAHRAREDGQERSCERAD